MYRFCCE